MFAASVWDKPLVHCFVLIVALGVTCFSDVYIIHKCHLHFQISFVFGCPFFHKSKRDQTTKYWSLTHFYITPRLFISNKVLNCKFSA